MTASSMLAAGRLVNLSSRAVAGTGADALTAGFVITGSVPKKILVRGAGPALTKAGVAGALTEARLELFRGSTSLGVNTHWDAGTDGAAIAQTATAVGAFVFAMGSNDAALLVTLAPGNYTALVTPARAGVAAGVALVEVYDAEPATASQLVNISTRAHAGTGPATLIAGFVVIGDGANRLLVRTAGPALTAFGVPGALADPRLELFQSAGVSIAYNDDWQGNTNAAQLALVAKNSGAFDFADGSKDAALLIPQASGAYTAQVVEAPDAGGVALIEVYDTSAYETLPPARVFDLVGFARVSGDGLATFTGGGTPTTLYDPLARTGNFWRIDDAVAAAPNFAAQLQAALSSSTPLVVELNTMLDLSLVAPPYNDSNSNPLAHPDLIPLGHVGRLLIGSNKTIYSAYGNGGFRRGTLNVGACSNVMLRNLKFRELWEWDDSTGGQYDRNGWDYIVVQSAINGSAVTARVHHVWIDHCDFEKSYDGLTDIVQGADLITMSWCKIAGVVSGETMRWVRRQFDYLEANRSQFGYYSLLRGFGSRDEIQATELFHKKANLIGNSTDAATRAHDLGYLNVTSHHNWYINVDDRMPRMRYGNAHVFNLLGDSRAGVGIGGLSRAGVTVTAGAAVRVENSTFIDVRVPVNNQIGTEPVGFVAVLDSASLDTATGLDRGFDPTRTVPLSQFTWNLPDASSGLGTWPVADTSVMPAGYVPPGTTLTSYLDDKNYLGSNLAYVGIITPANENEAALLRARWQATTH
jgi:pectate lyase